MDPSEWGPAGWLFLHSVTFAQPAKPNAFQQQKLRNFFESLGYLLPCMKCCKHFQEFVKKRPPPVDDREKLCRWLVDAHNNANKERRNRFPVKLPVFSYEDAVKKYAYETDVLVEESKNERKYIRWIIYSVSVVVLLSVVSVCVGVLWFSCSGGRTCPAHKLLSSCSFSFR